MLRYGSIEGDTGEQFAGLSANYRVLYFDVAVSAGAELSKRFGGGAGLEAGYHLLAVRSRTQAETDADDACFARARKQAASEFADAVSEFEAAHGIHVDIDETGTISCDELVEDCDEEALDSLAYDFAEVLIEHVLELGCSALNERYTPIEDPEAAPINIRIEPNVGPLAEYGWSL